MKICIPTADDRGLEASAAPHFGSAPYFTLVDAHGGLEVVRNPGCHQHTHACHHAPFLTEHKVDAVACPGMGRKAVAGLRGAGVEVLGPVHGTVAEVWTKARTGELAPLDLAAACGGGQQQGGCHPTRERRRRRARGSDPAQQP